MQKNWTQKMEERKMKKMKEKEKMKKLDDFFNPLMGSIHSIFSRKDQLLWWYFYDMDPF